MSDPSVLLEQPATTTMNFFLNWLRGNEDEGDFIPRPAAIQGELAATFKITAKDFGKFDGMPEHWF